MAKRSSQKPIDTEYRKRFGLRLAGARMMRGYRFARDFAADIGVNEHTVTAWERGQTIMGIEQLLEICLRLNITPNDLILESSQDGMKNQNLAQKIG